MRTPAMTELYEAVKHVVREVCLHADWRRGGMHWRICDHCGARWQEGDDLPERMTEKVERLYTALAALEQEQAQIGVSHA